MADLDDAARVVATVCHAHERAEPIAVVGAGSKAFLPAVQAQNSVSTRDHTGIVEYHPEELVVTARSGTRLRDLVSVLAAERQIIPFDPPCFAGDGTLGGALATGWSGPPRPWLGSARDCVLGVEIVNGAGERMSFGGRVMKNVAGFDVSRLMVGAFGSLGVILSASFKVLPAPEASVTMTRSASAVEAAAVLRDLTLRPLPVTATCHVDGALHIRLSGSDRSVWDAKEMIEGDALPGADAFWRSVRDHQHEFFLGDAPTWRLSLPRGTAFDESTAMTEWAGARVWWRADVPAEEVNGRAAALGGYATPFRNVAARQQIAAVEHKYMLRLKDAFDPRHVLNPGVVV